MKKILISACLLGSAVRYDGACKPIQHPFLRDWQTQGRLVPFCPEVAGGLPIPRPPAEITGGTGQDVLAGRAKVLSQKADVTAPFLAGAQAALALAKQTGISAALLKARSPSCGNDFIYDGSFTGTLIPGTGVTAALLRMNGILVFNENEMDALIKSIK